MAGIDPLTVMVVIMAIAIFILLKQFGLWPSRIKFLNRNTAGFNKATWIDPEFGVHTIMGSAKIGDKIYPISKDYGRHRILPIPRRPGVDLFPLNMDKMASGDPDGNVWMGLDETNPFMQSIKVHIDALSYNNTLLTLRVHALENELLRARSEIQDLVKREADWLGGVRKALGPSYVPQDRMGRPLFGGQE